ncbi:MAG: hypothetical protein ACLVHS_17955 [Blautia wexlerae]
MFEYFEGDKYNSFRQDYGEKYYDTVTCKVMFNQNGYISFRYSCKWYAGGVGNVWEYGLTYRLKDGKKMGIQDVLAGSRDSAKQRIASTYANKISSRGYEPIMKMKYSEFCFYIKPGKESCSMFWTVSANGRKWKIFYYDEGKNKLISSWYRVTEAWYEFKSYHASLLSDLLYVIFRHVPICFGACRKIL